MRALFSGPFSVGVCRAKTVRFRRGPAHVVRRLVCPGVPLGSPTVRYATYRTPLADSARSTSYPLRRFSIVAIQSSSRLMSSAMT